MSEYFHQPYCCTDKIRKKRLAGIYKGDSGSKLRCSHQTPFILAVLVLNELF
jgi:hypothetical protein